MRCEIELLPNERIEDLQYKGLRIIQSTEGYRFGTDSVILAGFAKALPREKAVDLCSGAGVISILLNGRTQADITAVEIQPNQCLMAEKSVKLNSQQHGIHIVNADIRNISAFFPRSVFDVAVCNPPYHSAQRGLVSQKGDEGFNGAATHSVCCTIQDLAASMDYLLKFGGRAYMCFPAARLAEFFVTLSSKGLEPKRLRLASSKQSKAPYLALLECKKGGKAGLIVEPTLILYDSEGNYTDELNTIYHRK